MLKKIREDGNKRYLTVIRPVLTRWTSHYHSLKRLIELKDAIKYLVADPTDQTITGSDRRSREKANAMTVIIRSEDFWKSIAEYAFFNHK